MRTGRSLREPSYTKAAYILGIGATALGTYAALRIIGRAARSPLLVALALIPCAWLAQHTHGWLSWVCAWGVLGTLGKWVHRARAWKEVGPRIGTKTI